MDTIKTYDIQKNKSKKENKHIPCFESFCFITLFYYD
jgi:hypothetical protein